MFAVASAAAVTILLGRAGIRMLTPLSSMPGTAASLAEPLTVLVAVNAGLVAIGKFSQPSAVLLIPGGYWLASAVLDFLAGNQGRRKPAAGTESGAMDGGAAVTRTLEGRAGLLRARRSVALIVAAVLVAGLVAGTIGQAASRLKPGYSYSRYLDRIRAHVPPDARVLAGLNTAFAFEPGKLHAYNDLAVLDEAGLSFAEYVGRHGIEFILYPSELDRIYAARPVWNALYGNVVPYYEEMRRFLAARCELVARLEEPVFAMRIIAYQEEETARLTVYRVLGSGP